MIENNPTNVEAAFEMLLKEIEAEIKDATTRQLTEGMSEPVRLTKKPNL